MPDPTPDPERQPKDPTTARGPVTDIEALGRIAFLTGYAGAPFSDWDELPIEGGKDVWHEIATAVRDQVCPEGSRVVPRAEHDRLLRLIPDLLSACETSGDEFAVDGFVRATIDDIAAAHAAYLVVLGEGGGDD